MLKDLSKLEYSLDHCWIVILRKSTIKESTKVKLLLQNCNLKKVNDLSILPDTCNYRALIVKLKNKICYNYYSKAFLSSIFKDVDFTSISSSKLHNKRNLPKIGLIDLSYMKK